jgi:hypothetical protein
MDSTYYGLRGQGLDADDVRDYPLVVRALAFALLLAIPASAQEGREETGARAQKARDLVEALPPEARVELKKMYRRYKDLVVKSLDAGWRTDVLSEAVIEDVDEPFQPARLVELMIDMRRKEIDRIAEALSSLPGDDPYNDKRLRAQLKAKKRDLAVLVSRGKREKGLCRDWSDLIWFEFSTMELEHWAARDERRSARPYHTGAVACSPAESPRVCLVFDPWADGRPSVFSFIAWDENSPGGRFPAEYFLHGLPDKIEEAP